MAEVVENATLPAARPETLVPEAVLEAREPASRVARLAALWRLATAVEHAKPVPLPVARHGVPLATAAENATLPAARQETLVPEAVRPAWQVASKVGQQGVQWPPVMAEVVENAWRVARREKLVPLAVPEAVVGPA